MFRSPAQGSQDARARHDRQDQGKRNKPGVAHDSTIGTQRMAGQTARRPGHAGDESGAEFPESAGMGHRQEHQVLGWKDAEAAP